MIRRSTVIWSALAIGVGVGLFFVKHEVQALEERLVAVNRDIAEHRETIHVLEAEWSHLTRPERLEDLGQRLLRLEPVAHDQTIDLSELDERLAEIEARRISESTGPAFKKNGKTSVKAVLADLEKRR